MVTEIVSRVATRIEGIKHQKSTKGRFLTQLAYSLFKRFPYGRPLRQIRNLGRATIGEHSSLRAPAAGRLAEIERVFTSRLS
jgi:hypothetical protein